MQSMQPSSSDAGQEQQQQQVEVRGWIRTVRQQKQFAFMQVGWWGGGAATAITILGAPEAVSGPYYLDHTMVQIVVMADCDYVAEQL